MGPAPYLLHVNSSPTQVTDKLWAEWYKQEHLPDLVRSGASVRATLYQEVPTPFNANPDHPRRFLVVYQTDYEDTLNTRNYTSLRKTSEMFRKEGAEDAIGKNGDFDARNYWLIQAYNPKNYGEVPSPEILTVEMHPHDEKSFEKWYREENLPLISRIPGYRRTLRYKLGPRTHLTKDDDPPMYLAIHEVDDVRNAFGSQEAGQANKTERAQKCIGESRVFVARGWRLVHSEGF